MSNVFKPGDILEEITAAMGPNIRDRGGNPKRLIVRSLDDAGDPIFTFDRPGSRRARYWSGYFEKIPDAMPPVLVSALLKKPLKFRSGCDVQFVAYCPEAKPHCQLVLLNPATGKGSDEPHNEPGDVLIKDAA